MSLTEFPTPRNLIGGELGREIIWLVELPTWKTWLAKVQRWNHLISWTPNVKNSNWLNSQCQRTWLVGLSISKNLIRREPEDEITWLAELPTWKNLISWTPSVKEPDWTKVQHWNYLIGWIFNAQESDWTRAGAWIYLIGWIFDFEKSDWRGPIT